LVELFGSERTGWKRPELALALGRAGDTSRVRQQLLEIGLGTARELGAVDVLMCFNPADISARALALQCGGTLDHDSGTAVVPCDPVATDGLRSWHSLNAEVA